LVAAVPACAQEDRLVKWRTEIELQKKAECAVHEKRLTTGLLQHEVDKLLERKTQIEVQLEYAQIKFQAAVRQLKAARETGANPEAQDRLDREVGGWDLRRKAARGDLKKVEDAIKEWVESFKVMTINSK
jgi:Zn ribbon nucleic-acid-binding protein